MATREPSSRTGHVQLRDVAEGDLPVFFEHQRDPVANRMAGFPPRDRDAFVAHWAKILADEMGCNILHRPGHMQQVFLCRASKVHSSTYIRP